MKRIMLVILAALLFVCAESPAETKKQAYDPVAKWGKAKVASAKKVMSLAKQNSKIYEDGPYLVVEMRWYIDNRNDRLAYVRSIADADVILTGEPRSIFYYDPSMKQIAKADRYDGIRLLE